MKKALSLILALVICLSLCACGGGNDTPKTTEAPTEATEAPTEATEAQLSKEELITKAIKTDVMTLQRATSNIPKAKLDYCNKPIIVSGNAASVEDNYVVIRDSQVSVHAYLSIEDLVKIKTGKEITVVGIISDIQEVTEGSGIMTFTFDAYIMDVAYLIED